MFSTKTILFIAVVSILGAFSFAAVDTFVYGGCSQAKYFPGSHYESNVNSLLTSFVSSASLSTYNNFTVNGISGGDSSVYGLYQCRGDLSSASGDCARCVARAVSRLGSLCVGACGGALQLEGCFVKYDNSTFLGVEDKTVVVRRCGSPVGYNSDELTRRDSVVGYLAASSGGSYRVGVSGELQGVAQCTGDLSGSDCQDCLMEAIGRLKSDCSTAAWGDVYLAKCYARYWLRGGHSRSNGYGGDRDNNDDEIEKTLAIIVGLIAGVTLLVVFLSFMAKSCERAKGQKKQL
ncbi:cysteine-rich repeat secretory protein 12 isoform X2 [Eutrema salsugineum]|uniref:cysteine-rich repeat secretory protein 12 isoform X2 n=1 Tax=Eutrema salsugineum TaxID=72664 RepID=UPI000CED08A3|nr:cysteine-rich repeat secretory protein 12 isoform X2 [Eutrema salsugineum]